MRILVTTDLWFPDYIGGSARVARESSVALATRGHSVTVLAPAFRGKPVVEVVDGITVYRRVRRSGLVPQTYSDPLMYRAALREWRGASFDVVISHHLGGAAAALSAPRLAPCVYVFHASPLREARYRRSQGLRTIASIRSRVVEPGLAVLERFVESRANRIFAISAFSRGLIEQDHAAYSPSVVVLSGGVNTDVYSPAVDRDALRRRLGVRPGVIVLLTVRRLVSRMGVDVLLRAVRLLRRRHPNMRLIIVGAGEWESRLRALARELQVEPFVAFKGRLPDKAVVEWYQAADIFVLPTIAFEGFGMVTAEALAAGTPVIGTPVGATPELLAPLDPQFVASDATDLAIADAVSSLVPKLGAEMRRSCRTYAVDRLAWSSVIAGWEDALGELVAVS